MLRLFMAATLLTAAGATSAQDEDPKLAAALLQCPGAAVFVQTERARGQEQAQRLVGIVPSQPQLREQLLEMMRIDQEARDGEWSPPMVERMHAVDAANLPKIRKIVADHGSLPSARQVGADGVSAAWLLVQHADRDPAFQQQVLDRIMPLVESGDVSSREIALLTDRVLVNAGAPQRYGSQLAAINGKWEPKPMEAPEQVDQRRASLGQMPLADYLCVATQIFPPPPAGSLTR
jgi:hypothetical protein